MELHAWLNPYRAELSGGSSVSANHVINKHPDGLLSVTEASTVFLILVYPKLDNMFYRS